MLVIIISVVTILAFVIQLVDVKSIHLSAKSVKPSPTECEILVKNDSPVMTFPYEHSYLISEPIIIQVKSPVSSPFITVQAPDPIQVTNDYKRETSSEISFIVPGKEVKFLIYILIPDELEVSSIPLNITLSEKDMIICSKQVTIKVS